MVWDFGDHDIVMWQNSFLLYLFCICPHLPRRRLHATEDQKSHSYDINTAVFGQNIVMISFVSLNQPTSAQQHKQGKLKCLNPYTVKKKKKVSQNYSKNLK